MPPIFRLPTVFNGMLLFFSSHIKIVEINNKNIDIRRLRAKPYARFCIACRELYEKQNSKK